MSTGDWMVTCPACGENYIGTIGHNCSLEQMTYVNHTVSEGELTCALVERDEAREWARRMYKRALEAEAALEQLRENYLQLEEMYSSWKWAGEAEHTKRLEAEAALAAMDARVAELEDNVALLSVELQTARMQRDMYHEQYERLAAGSKHD